MSEAFGAPGAAPTWTTGAKSAVGTSAGDRSTVWFTISHGIVNEVYYPRVDTANMSDAQFLVTGNGADGAWFAEEKRDTKHAIERLDPWAPAFRIVNTCPAGRFRITKEIVTDPDRHSLIQHVTFEPLSGTMDEYGLYALICPHLNNLGYRNNARVIDCGGMPALQAYYDPGSGKEAADEADRPAAAVYVTVLCSAGFKSRSVGYVGHSDGWTDLSRNKRMTWAFDSAPDGHVALTGRIPVPEDGVFTLVFGFGATAEEAGANARDTLGSGYEDCLSRYVDEWRTRMSAIRDLSAMSGDGGALFRSSVQVLITHQDKLSKGGTIASLAFPWGGAREANGKAGGYHLVWPRDLVQAAAAHLAVDDIGAARDILLYLSRIQQESGGWHQNNWIDGRPFWEGVQLDETAFPIILAWRLHKLGALGDFDPWPLAERASAFLVKQGPVTGQERWEEDGGYSPSTLAAMIAGLLCAAELATGNGEKGKADYLREVADWWASNLDAWTYTTNSLLDPELPAHYERINTVVVGHPERDDPHEGKVPIRNLAPDVESEFPVGDVVDAGFLQLVDYGIRRPDDPHIAKSLKVIDKVLKVELPGGPSWFRYNHDGYGEHENGDPFTGWGIGQAWPILTGERAHYELAAGNRSEAERLARAMEAFSTEHKLLPEQLWTLGDIPDKELYRGKPSGSAMPLVWAHAEYVNLLRSLEDGRLFDPVPPAADRYEDGPPPMRNVWRFNHKVSVVNSGEPLRIEVLAPAMLHWSGDNWHTVHHDPMTASGFGTYYFDVPRSMDDGSTSVRFTFFWTEPGTWEGTDFAISVRDPALNTG